MQTHLKPYELAILKMPSMTEVLKHVEKAASEELKLLLYGDTGTGKTFLARHYHEVAGRKNYPFVDVNCSISNELSSSDWFGHKRGSFTGATAERTGYIELANNGTLFVDEVQNMPMALQHLLIKYLENDGKYRKVGGDTSKTSDALLVFGSNVRLKEKVKEGNFRPDLHQRIGQYWIEIPTLKDREDEIYLIADQLLKGINQKRETNLTLDTSVDAILKEHDWPGNLRELHGALTYACVMGNDPNKIQATVLRQAIERNKAEFNYENSSTTS